jgi:hypothetical protein
MKTIVLLAFILLSCDGKKSSSGSSEEAQAVAKDRSKTEGAHMPKLNAYQGSADFRLIAKSMEKAGLSLATAQRSAAGMHDAKFKGLGLTDAVDPIEVRIQAATATIDATAVSLGVEALKLAELEEKFLFTGKDGQTELQGQRAS